MIARRNANGDFSHDDYVLVEDNEFGGEETPRVKKGGWAEVVQELYFDEEREREREREFLESLRQVSSNYSLPFLTANQFSQES